MLLKVVSPTFPMDPLLGKSKFNHQMLPSRSMILSPRTRQCLLAHSICNLVVVRTASYAASGEQQLRVHVTFNRPRNLCKGGQAVERADTSRVLRLVWLPSVLCQCTSLFWSRPASTQPVTCNLRFCSLQPTCPPPCQAPSCPLPHPCRPSQSPWRRPHAAVSEKV